MTSRRDLIISCYENVVSLFCDDGVPASHLGHDYKVTYYRTGKVREVCEFKNNQKDGVQIRYAISRMPTSIVHYRRGSRWGECKLLDPHNGLVLKSTYFSGSAEIPYREATAEQVSAFSGYLIEKYELTLDEVFEPMGRFLKTFVQ